jgi:uncharacterized RDD family membrane protein YckC
MTRIEHLKFCSICIHQKEDMRKGIVCGLTGSIADFEDTCHSFAEDPEIIEQLKLTGIENEVTAKMASQGKRFLNYLLDMVFIMIFIFIFAIILGIVLALVEHSSLSDLGDGIMPVEYLISFMVICIYYIIFEVTTGRSIAKYITKTKVVTEIGEKPAFNMILVRTICRFIPFEVISILFNDGSCWHDSISKTKVGNI